jgi:hypothetical protein
LMTRFIAHFGAAHNYNLQFTLHTHCTYSRLHYRCLVTAFAGGRSLATAVSTGS